MRNKRILVTGAGGSPSTNFIRSLRTAPEKFYIIGTDADKYYLMRSEADKNYLVPKVSDASFIPIINYIIKKEKIDFIHIQNDVEVVFFSENREKINAPMFLPDKETIRICQDKYASYSCWEKSRLKVPKTMMIKTIHDVEIAFKKFGEKIWLRAIKGAGGKGSLAVKTLKEAKTWIDFHKGWGNFSAAELLKPESITWMSIWYEGDLIVAQGRKRLYWELSKISPSGITGATGAGETVRNSRLDSIAIKAIKAIDKNPHGLFGVDLTYDKNNIPNPTEINIGRFFTTHHFFTEAGLNMPYFFVKLAFKEKLPKINRKLNPLHAGLVWIRGIDFEPILTTGKKIEKNVFVLEKIKKSLRQ